MAREKLRTITIRRPGQRPTVVAGVSAEHAAELARVAKTRGATARVTRCSARAARAIAEGGQIR